MLTALGLALLSAATPAAAQIESSLVSGLPFAIGDAGNGSSGLADVSPWSPG